MQSRAVPLVGCFLGEGLGRGVFATLIVVGAAVI